jgi:tRNA A37 threonylcarbamoyladenosine modification protein TsaB
MAQEADAWLGAARRDRLLAVAVDARRSSIYLQLFPSGHHGAGPPQLCSAHAAARRIGVAPAIIVGSGAEPVVRALAAADGQAEARLPELLPAARSLALLATELAPIDPLRPLYLRLPDAKPQADPCLPRSTP